MLETIRQFYDQAAEAANECADLAEQTANDAVNSASELATQAYDAVAVEAESLLTQAEQVIPSLSADLTSTFVSTADSLDKTGHAFVTSVKSTASSLWKADLTSTLTDTLSSLSSTIKPYVPEFLQPYLADDSSESQVAAATEENTDAWYSPLVSLARSVQAYVFGAEPESAPVVASVLQSAEAVYAVDEAPVVTEKVAAEPKQKAKQSLSQTPVDFFQPSPEFVSSVSSFSDDSLLSLSSSVVDTYTSDADFVSVPVSYASLASTPETTLVADASWEAVSVIPESTSTEGAVVVVPQVVVVAAQDQAVLPESATSGVVVAAESSTRYLGYGETSYATLDSAFFGAQWINSVSPATVSGISSTGAVLLGASQNSVAFNQVENASLIVGANSFGSSASVAQGGSVKVQGSVINDDDAFAVGASVFPVSETALFLASSSLAQAAAASLKNSSEILHVQQAAHSGVSPVLPSPFPMVFVNGLVTTIGKNKEQAQAVAEMTLPLTTVQSQGQMSGGSDSDHPGRQSETEALAFDELASIINSTSVQTSVASADEDWDAPFIPQTRDVYAGA